MPTTTRPLLNMMEHAYRIRNWKDHFETYETEKVKGPLKWVAIPTKHDGRGYKRMTKLQHGVQAMCGWWSMLQVAAKMPVHGLLADRDGPLDAEDIAEKTNLPMKIYLTAFKAASDEKIGWLETVPWNRNLDFAGNIAALIASQHLPADALGFQRTTAHSSAKQRTTKQNSSPAEPLLPQRIAADNSASAEKTADNSASAELSAAPSVQDRTRQDITIPPAVPQGGQPAGNLILNPDIAKRLICEKILGGKDPNRAWSHDAMYRLSELCAPPGMPLQEILDVAEYRSIPKSDDIPELKFRVEPATETSIMRYWGDEVARARDYLKKYRRNGTGSATKKEPPLWREFFRWKYTEQCELPDRFEQLDPDQKNEWERDHEAFLSSRAGQEAAAAA